MVSRKKFRSELDKNANKETLLLFRGSNLDDRQKQYFKISSLHISNMSNVRWFFFLQKCWSVLTLSKRPLAKFRSDLPLKCDFRDYETPHCSYFDIYISQKIRLCVVNLEGEFQTNLQTKPITFLVRKFRSIIINFLLFFAEFVKSTAFYTLLLLF